METTQTEIQMDTYYSRPIEMPKTRKEGLLNNIQMIINAAERGETREALLIAVDLLDTISGNSNPFSSVTESFTKDAVVREVAAMRETFEDEKRAAIAKAFQDGSRFAKQEMLSRLQAA